VPIMSAEDFSAYLRKTYPQLTEAELSQMCREAGYDLTPPLPAVAASDSMKKPRSRGARDPKSFSEFIMEAIDEVAPGRGAGIYWLAFRRFNEDGARRKQAEAEKDLASVAPRPRNGRSGKPRGIVPGPE
jgi:hypothetical protein